MEHEANIELTQIKEIMRPKIEALGYRVDEFNIGHFEGFQDLTTANIEVTDNLINPNIEESFFAIFTSMVARNPEDQECQRYKPVLQHLCPGLNMHHIKKLRDAIESNNFVLLQRYIDVFSNLEISQKKRNSIADLIEMDQAAEHLLNPEFSDEEAQQQRREAFTNRYPDKINVKQIMV